MNANTTDEQLSEIERKAQAATKGEWKKRTHPVYAPFVQAPREDPTHPYDIELLGDDITLYSTREADMDFIVACQPAVVLGLLAELRAARSSQSKDKAEGQEELRHE